MWSLGCILFEMIHSTYKELPSREKHAFQGDSCYPISPINKTAEQDEADVNVISKGDQMLCILRMLGDQNTNDLSFIANKKAKKYIKNLQTGNVKTDFKEMFPDTNKEILSLLEDLLSFNPGFRPTAKECIQRSVFNEIRDPNLEMLKPDMFYQEIY